MDVDSLEKAWSIKMTSIDSSALALFQKAVVIEGVPDGNRRKGKI
jgi:hypothetical protein